MCDFIGITTAVLSIAQGAASAASANQQHKQRMEEVRQNAENASRAAEDQYSQLNIKQQQEDAAANQQRLETNIEAARARSSVEVAAAEGGVEGLAVSALLNDVYAQQGRHDAALDTNQRMTRDYLKTEKKAVQAGGQSQINSVPLPEKPSFAPFLLQTFSSGLNSYTDFKKRKG